MSMILDWKVLFKIQIAKNDELSAGNCRSDNRESKCWFVTARCFCTPFANTSFTTDCAFSCMCNTIKIDNLKMFILVQFPIS